MLLLLILYSGGVYLLLLHQLLLLLSFTDTVLIIVRDVMWSMNRRLARFAKVKFVASLGNDQHAQFLKNVLTENQLDLTDCEEVDAESGLGLVFLSADGAVCSIVVAGANARWSTDEQLQKKFERIFSESNVSCTLLQMEVPARVNEIVARIAKKHGAAVCQDVGGENREISASHLQNCDILSPNLSELQRMTNMPVDTEADIIAAAKLLQQRGAKGVLVTRGRQGALLLTESGEVVALVPV